MSRYMRTKSSQITYKYLGVRIAIESNVATASSPPPPISAIAIIFSRNTYLKDVSATNSDYLHQILNEKTLGNRNYYPSTKILNNALKSELKYKMRFGQQEARRKS